MFVSGLCHGQPGLWNWIWSSNTRVGNWYGLQLLEIWLAVRFVQQQKELRRTQGGRERSLKFTTGTGIKVCFLRYYLKGSNCFFCIQINHGMIGWIRALKKQNTGRSPLFSDGWYSDWYTELLLYRTDYFPNGLWMHIAVTNTVEEGKPEDFFTAPQTVYAMSKKRHKLCCE